MLGISIGTTLDEREMSDSDSSEDDTNPRLMRTQNLEIVTFKTLLV